MIPSACRACAPRARSPVSLGGGARPLTGFTRPPRGGRPRREEVKLPRGASQVGPSRPPAETPRPPLCRRMNPGSNFFAREAPPPPPPTHLQRRHPASQVNPRLRRGGGSSEAPPRDAAGVRAGRRRAPSGVSLPGAAGEDRGVRGGGENPPLGPAGDRGAPGLARAGICSRPGGAPRAPGRARSRAGPPSDLGPGGSGPRGAPGSALGGPGITITFLHTNNK